MSEQDLRELVSFMVSEVRAEWIEGQKDDGAFWVWWKRPEEWAEVLAGWVCYSLLCIYARAKVEVINWGYVWLANGVMDEFFCLFR